MLSRIPKTDEKLDPLVMLSLGAVHKAAFLLFRIAQGQHRACDMECEPAVCMIEIVADFCILQRRLSHGCSHITSTAKVDPLDVTTIQVPC